jgi:hypothetical protein
MNSNMYGKLITLTNIEGVPEARRILYPYGSLPFYFHTPPGEYRVGGSKNRAEQSIPGYGTVSQHGGPGLKSVTFDSIFSVRQWLEINDNPLTGQREYPGYIIAPYGELAFFDAFQSIKMMETLRDGDYPIMLNILDRQISGHAELNMMAEVSEFEWSEVDGEPDVRAFSVSFIQWKPTRLRRVPHAGGIPSTGTQRPSTSGCGTYKVTQDGIGIKAIAKSCYGRADRYQYIISKNGGLPWLKGLMAKKQVTYQPKHAEGPWFFSKGVSMKTPAYPKTTKK